MMIEQTAIDLANAEINRVFESTSVIWRTISRWETGDPMMTTVPSDNPEADRYMDVSSESITFELDHAMALDDAEEVIGEARRHARTLAAAVDDACLAQLIADGGGSKTSLAKPTTPASNAAAQLQKNGYRGPSAIIATEAHFTALNSVSEDSKPRLVREMVKLILDVDSIDTAAGASTVVLGRAGGTGERAAALEPMDIAVVQPPSLEYVGPIEGNKLRFRISMRYALRIKDKNAIVVWK